MLIVGGDSPDARGTSELYDPAANEWSNGPSPATPRRSGHTATALYTSACAAASAPLYCGLVLLVGGRPGDNAQLTDQVEIFSSADDEWQNTSPLSDPVGDHSAVLIDHAGCEDENRCGDVLITGGTDEAGVGRSATSMFEAPETSGGGTWVPLPSMSAGRHDNAAALLSDGRVLVTGGGGVDELDEDSTEYWDPDISDWRVTGYMSTARYQHTATPLPDGRVLVAGGAKQKPVKFQQSAEIYDPAAPTFPGKVQEFAVRLVSATEAELKWKAPGTIEGSSQDDRFRNDPPAREYIVKHSTSPIDAGNFDDASSLCDGGVCQYSPPSIGSELKLYVEDLQPDRHHYFAIKARAEDGSVGEMSDVVSVQTKADPPGTVDDLSALPLTGRKIRLSFGAVGSDGNDGPPARKYVIRQTKKGPIDSARAFEEARPLCGGVCRFGPDEIGDKLRLVVTDLRPRTTYYYALRAKDDAGNLGLLSNDASAKTPADTIAPGRVRGVRVATLSKTKLRVSFKAAASDGSEGPPVRDYIVKQSRRRIDTAREFRRARTLCGSTCRFSPVRVGDRLRITVTGLCPNTTYHYALRARDTAGNVGRMSESKKGTTDGRRRC